MKQHHSRNLSRYSTILVILVLAAVLLLVAGVGYLYTFLAVVGFGCVLLRFTRKENREDLLPTARVSCCHYLGDVDSNNSPESR